MPEALRRTWEPVASLTLLGRHEKLKDGRVTEDAARGLSQRP
jgi:hypothetical protein